MATGKKCVRAVKLEVVQRRFERWRQTRPPRSRIPGGLWAAAVMLASSHGIHRVSKALRLDYYSLKKRVEQRSAVGSDSAADDSACAAAKKISAPFWELAPAVELAGAALSTGQCECRLELQNTAGSKLRVHLRGIAAPDLAALSRSFWNPTS